MLYLTACEKNGWLIMWARQALVLPSRNMLLRIGNLLFIRYMFYMKSNMRSERREERGVGDPSGRAACEACDSQPASDRQSRAAMGAAQMGLAMSQEGQSLKAQTGVVKWFDPKKGFGFVVGPDSQDIFVHYTTIVGNGGSTTPTGW